MVDGLQFGGDGGIIDTESCDGDAGILAMAQSVCECRNQLGQRQQDHLRIYDLIKNNHDGQMSMEETALAYGTAVTASVTAAIGMNRWVQKSRLLSDASRAFAARFVPFVAVVPIICQC